MAYYNVPNGNQSAGLYELTKFITNDTTAGLLFFVILLVVWIIAFLSLKRYSNSKAFLTAGFFCSVLGIILAVLDLIAPKFMYLFIIFTVIGMVWVKLDDGQ